MNPKHDGRSEEVDRMNSPARANHESGINDGSVRFVREQRGHSFRIKVGVVQQRVQLGVEYPACRKQQQGECERKKEAE